MMWRAAFLLGALIAVPALAGYGGASLQITMRAGVSNPEADLEQEARNARRVTETDQAWAYVTVPPQAAGYAQELAMQAADGVALTMGVPPVVWRVDVVCHTTSCTAYAQTPLPSAAIAEAP